MDVMSRLKTSTRELHTATEQLPVGRAMTDGTITRAAYVALIAAYARMHGALEEALSVATHPVVSAVAAPLVRRAALARADLEALREPPPSTPTLERSLAALECALRVADGPRLLGMTYVLEGASLGGVFLAPRLASALSLRDEELRFFRGHGPATMTHWASFKARMNDCVVDDSDVELAVTAAQDIFAGLFTLFEAIDHATRAAGSPSEVTRWRPQHAHEAGDRHRVVSTDLAFRPGEPRAT